MEYANGWGKLFKRSFDPSRSLRLVSKEMRYNIDNYPYKDKFRSGYVADEHGVSHIRGSAQLWRACFPTARSANLCRRSDLYFADFEALQGLWCIDVSQSMTLRDEHFVNFKGIHTLYMNDCRQVTITDKAFESLAGIHTLELRHCNQSTITDLAFETPPSP